LPKFLPIPASFQRGRKGSDATGSYRVRQFGFVAAG
jgi:hypothetical protein